MPTGRLLRKLMKLWLVIILFSIPGFSIPSGSGSAAATAPTAVKPDPAKIQASVTLYGAVKDQAGNPIQTNIYVTDRQNNPLANLLTNAKGEYSVTIPEQENMVVNAFPLGLPENLIAMPGGNQILKYFELTKGIMPAGDRVEVNFTLPNAAVLQLDAYSPAGSLMNFDAVNETLNPSEYYGYGGVYGVFPR
jgi:hypothetical protein